jgi:hypothetical protein
MQWRDLKQIGIRARYVIVPLGDTSSRKELKNWDLWGPLVLCIVLAVYPPPHTALSP